MNHRVAATLPRVLQEGDDDALLDRESRRRRDAAVDVLRAQAIANKTPMEERDPAARRAKLDALRRSAENRGSARAFMRCAALADSQREAAAVQWLVASSRGALQPNPLIP